MIALGTGVGYSVVVDSKQHLGHFGMLEGGHMIINPQSDRLCGCGQYGESLHSPGSKYANEDVRYYVYVDVDVYLVVLCCGLQAASRRTLVRRTPH